jgi:uncharacterized protein YyaL (SSP411 family)
MPNRLQHERSPYLLQHANNPVDWYPWGEEAFARARAEQKPIFLSIGYSTCHWCHVMEHESFEDEILADVLNQHFISIKVDREERPDIDRVYMTFVQATTGAGGWPMSVFLTPDRKPFFGGTYFPPVPRWGQRSFGEVLNHVQRAWADNAAAVVASADRIVDQLRDHVSPGEPITAPVAGPEAIPAAIDQFVSAYDRRHGGFGGAPKFPRPSELLCLLDGWALTHRHEARQMVADTLKAMSLGGMHDHIGGGYHRYSVDAEWRVPHFEKMLYDQAQLVLALVTTTQVTGDGFFATMAEDTLDYVAADLSSADGAFLSAEDADSLVPGGTEKKEGAFYVFSGADIDRWFGADAPIVRRRLGIEDGGNAPQDPHGEFVGQNIPYVAQSVEEIAARTGRSDDDVLRVITGMRQRLYEERAARPRPHLDDKVISAWNGLMIAAAATAGRVLVDSPRRQEWTDAAVRAATAVRATLWREDSRTLLRRYRDNEAAIDGFCEDYACMAWGLVELFQATADPQWLTWARALVDEAVVRFFDETDAGWFSTDGRDQTVLLRVKEDYDGAEPAAASVMVRVLLQLAQLTGEGRYADLAQRSLERYGPELGRVARVMPLMISNAARWHAPHVQVVIVGEPGAEREALERELASRHLPGGVSLVVSPGTEQERLAATLPWIGAMASGRETAAGRGFSPAAYVCRNFTCQAPVTEPAALAALLDEAAAPRTLL